MGDSQNLAKPAQLAHQLADLMCHRAPDSGVDFVEYQGGSLLQQAGGDGDGQRDA